MRENKELVDYKATSEDLKGELYRVKRKLQKVENDLVFEKDRSTATVTKTRGRRTITSDQSCATDGKTVDSSMLGKWEGEKRLLLKIISEERDKVTAKKYELEAEQKAHDNTKINLEKCLRTLLGSIELLRQLGCIE